jgi:hypothetical protein
MSTRFHEPDRCPRCKRGLVLECNFGWWCSRRYAKRSPCDWEKGYAGPLTDSAAHGSIAVMLTDPPTRRPPPCRHPRRSVLRSSRVDGNGSASVSERCYICGRVRRALFVKVSDTSKAKLGHWRAEPSGA